MAALPHFSLSPFPHNTILIIHGRATRRDDAILTTSSGPRDVATPISAALHPIFAISAGNPVPRVRRSCSTSCPSRPGHPPPIAPPYRQHEHQEREVGTTPFRLFEGVHPRFMVQLYLLVLSGLERRVERPFLAPIFRGRSDRNKNTDERPHGTSGEHPVLSLRVPRIVTGLVRRYRHALPSTLNSGLRTRADTSLGGRYSNVGKAIR